MTMIKVLDFYRTIIRGCDRFVGDFAQVYLTGTQGADVARDWRFKWERSQGFPVGTGPGI